MPAIRAGGGGVPGGSAMGVASGSRGWRGRRTGIRAFVLVLFLCLASPGPALAQRPGELLGRVTERGSGVPVAVALVELVELDRRAVTDAAGAYLLRGLEPGLYTLRVTALGYAAHVQNVTVENGRTHRLDVALAPVALPLEPLTVLGVRNAGGVRIERGEIERSGVRTAGELLEGVPGVVVQRTGPNAAQTVSIRGSGADAVLVLLDGVALNDAVTGEADLSAVPADAIESVTVLPGAHSARYGPRAEAGVVLIETRRGVPGPRAVLGGGSLGAWSTGLELGGGGPAGWGVGVRLRGLDGEFDFELPAEVGGGAGRRRNADLTQLALFAGVSPRIASGELSVRGGYEVLRRGLPGKGFVPSPRARQDLGRGRASAAWKRTGATRSVHVALAGARQTTRYRDPAPPLGLPYDDTTTAESVELRAEVERAGGGVRRLMLGGGTELRWQRIRASALSRDAPRDRLEVGVFASGAGGTRLAAGQALLAAQARLDLDDISGRWYLSHGVTGTLVAGPLALHLAHRSSFSPPSLGDQFFRESVGVLPNPELRGERVPSELEAGAATELAFGGVTGSLRVAAYHGDVRDMIVWAPDYRFVWSPRNTDVLRRGVETSAALAWPARDLEFSFSHSYVWVTYDRGPGAEAVQVIYRPRHTASVGLEWSPDPWVLRLDSRLTGERNAVPSGANTLPRFWTFAAQVTRSWALGRYSVEAALRVDRLFDEKASLIFGFPEPGRTLAVEARIRPRGQPPGP